MYQQLMENDLGNIALLTAIYINWKQQIIEFALLIPRRRFRISSSYQLFFASYYAWFQFHTCSISEQLPWIYLFNALPYGMSHLLRPFTSP